MKSKDLIKKYESGETSLEEEKHLFENSEISEPSLFYWGKFIELSKRKPKNNLENDIWEKIQINNRRKNSRIIFGVLSAAALIAIVFSLLFLKPKKEMQSLKEKEELLKEAITMVEVSEQNSIKKKVQNNEVQSNKEKEKLLKEALIMLSVSEQNNP